MADVNQAGVYLGTPNMAAPASYFARDFYVYELDFFALANGSSATSNFTIQADSDFFWTSAMYLADIAAATLTDSTRVIPLVTVLITDTGSGRQLMSSAMPLASLFGTGQLPFVLPRQRLFKANSTITVTAANYSTASTYNFRLSFLGEKAFK
jgi:hypothetical protein